MNPNSLSYPFPLLLPLSFARSRESKDCSNSRFDWGVGLRERGRCPLKPSIFASLLETKGYPEHTGARSSSESHKCKYFRLTNNWLKIYDSLVLCSTQSCTYIFATMFLIETHNFSMLTLHCWFAQQYRISLTRENITKTHAIDIHTLADGKFVIYTCRLWWRNSQLAMMYDVTVTKWRLIL